MPAGDGQSEGTLNEGAIKSLEDFLAGPEAVQFLQEMLTFRGYPRCWRQTLECCQRLCPGTYTNNKVYEDFPSTFSTLQLEVI